MNKKDELEMDGNLVFATKEDDILAKLLGVSETPEATIQIPRIGIELKIKALTQKEITGIRKECTTRKKVSGVYTEKVNNTEYDAGIIVGASTNFNWNNPKLLESISASDGKAYINRKLFPGEISFLVNKILELSGFNDELQEKEEIKNS